MRSAGQLPQDLAHLDLRRFGLPKARLVENRYSFARPRAPWRAGAPQVVRSLRDGIPRLLGDGMAALGVRSAANSSNWLGQHTRVQAEVAVSRTQVPE